MANNTDVELRWWANKVFNDIVKKNIESADRCVIGPYIDVGEFLHGNCRYYSIVNGKEYLFLEELQEAYKEIKERINGNKNYVNPKCRYHTLKHENWIINGIINNEIYAHYARCTSKFGIDCVKSSHASFMPERYDSIGIITRPNCRVFVDISEVSKSVQCNASDHELQELWNNDWRSPEGFMKALNDHRSCNNKLFVSVLERDSRFVHIPLLYDVSGGIVTVNSLHMPRIISDNSDDVKTTEESLSNNRCEILPNNIDNIGHLNSPVLSKVFDAPCDGKKWSYILHDDIALQSRFPINIEYLPVRIIMDLFMEQEESLYSSKIGANNKSCCVPRYSLCHEVTSENLVIRSNYGAPDHNSNFSFITGIQGPFKNIPIMNGSGEGSEIDRRKTEFRKILCNPSFDTRQWNTDYTEMIINNDIARDIFGVDDCKITGQYQKLLLNWPILDPYYTAPDIWSLPFIEEAIYSIYTNPVLMRHYKLILRVIPINIHRIMDWQIRDIFSDMNALPYLMAYVNHVHTMILTSAQPANKRDYYKIMNDAADLAESVDLAKPMIHVESVTILDKKKHPKQELFKHTWKDLINACDNANNSESWRYPIHIGQNTIPVAKLLLLEHDWITPITNACSDNIKKHYKKLIILTLQRVINIQDLLTLCISWASLTPYQ